MNTTGRLLAFAVLAACVCPSIAAQSESFADFRKKVLSDFNDFRSSVLENYDKFLEGAWEDFDQIKGEKSNPVPKPRTAPAVGTTEPPVINTAPTLPAPVTATTPTPKQSPAPKARRNQLTSHRLQHRPTGSAWLTYLSKSHISTTTYPGAFQTNRNSAHIGAHWHKPNSPLP